MTPLPDTEAALRESAGDAAQPLTLSLGWIASPVLFGALLTALAILGHVWWAWDGFWTGTLVEFGSAISLVSLFFLLERRFERRRRRERARENARTLPSLVHRPGLAAELRDVAGAAVAALGDEYPDTAVGAGIYRLERRWGLGARSLRLLGWDGDPTLFRANREIAEGPLVDRLRSGSAVAIDLEAARDSGRREGLVLPPDLRPTRLVALPLFRPGQGQRVHGAMLVVVEREKTDMARLDALLSNEELRAIAGIAADLL